MLHRKRPRCPGGEGILPYSVRRRIARSLAMLRTKSVERPWRKHDNIPL